MKRRIKKQKYDASYWKFIDVTNNNRLNNQIINNRINVRKIVEKGRTKTIINEKYITSSGDVIEH